ncbi:MAG TPA: hypothetical protein VFO77_13335 [Actinoplanes sp.]|nr:hypothetical protein [Actinoplanes sp.]
MSSTNVLAEIVGRQPSGPAPADIPAILAAVQQQHARPALRIRRCEPTEGPAFWRWDCGRCGEYGGGRHHADAITRAMRHCAEHPEHRSSLLPPVRCRENDAGRRPVHPAMFAVDDDPGPVPLSI